MKKALTVALFGLLGITVANAEIFIRYQSLNGFYRSDDTTELLAPGPTTALLQLIYTPNADYSDPANVLGGGVDGDELILDTAVIDTANNNSYATFAFTDPTPATFASGYIYVRVFDQGTTDGADVLLGSYYYDGLLQATVDNQTVNPTVYDVNGASPSSAFAGADFLNKQVVPEPATFALMGLGGIALAIRRRMRA